MISVSLKVHPVVSLGQVIKHDGADLGAAGPVQVAAHSALQLPECLVSDRLRRIEREEAGGLGFASRIRLVDVEQRFVRHVEQKQLVGAHVGALARGIEELAVALQHYDRWTAQRNATRSLQSPSRLRC
ncbi:hypothetical protein BRADI_2g03251v3 [Brachypodium distachyon]|uniref:Uncharacterized protein n=1 Tax=Brachypodium distachyon TaxID=15368 RepID=A0A0Q3MEC2_BRADI|nr:hypothetical protein BRADI_2g03251v3 [Brachypodium distachyon]